MILLAQAFDLSAQETEAHDSELYRKTLSQKKHKTNNQHSINELIELSYFIHESKAEEMAQW